jgi:hypothetical protein
MSPRSFCIGRSLTGFGLFATKPIGRGVYIATGFLQRKWIADPISLAANPCCNCGEASEAA